MLERASPIAAHRSRTGAGVSDGGRRVRIAEVCDGYLAQIDAFRGRRAEVAERLATAAGAALPPPHHAAATPGGGRLFPLVNDADQWDVQKDVWEAARSIDLYVWIDPKKRTWQAFKPAGAERLAEACDLLGIAAT